MSSEPTIVVWAHSSADASVADTTYFGIALGRSAIGPVWSRHARARPCQVSRASSSASAASARSSAPCRPASLMYGRSASAGGASMTPSSVACVCAAIEVMRVRPPAAAQLIAPHETGARTGPRRAVEHAVLGGGRPLAAPLTHAAWLPRRPRYNARTDKLMSAARKPAVPPRRYMTTSDSASTAADDRTIVAGRQLRSRTDHAVADPCRQLRRRGSSWTACDPEGATRPNGLISSRTARRQAALMSVIDLRHPTETGPVTDAMVILLYVPALIGLPILLLAGILFVVVPGGFIIVVGALGYALMSFLGMVGLAAKSRWQAARATRRQDRAGSVVTRKTTRSPARPVAAAAAPIAAGFLNGQSAGLQRDLLTHRGEPDGVSGVPGTRIASARSASDQRRAA